MDHEAFTLGKGLHCLCSCMCFAGALAVWNDKTAEYEPCSFSAEEYEQYHYYY